MWPVFLESQALFWAVGAPWWTSSRGFCPCGAHGHIATVTSATKGRNKVPTELVVEETAGVTYEWQAGNTIDRLWGWVDLRGDEKGGVKGCCQDSGLCHWIDSVGLQRDILEEACSGGGDRNPHRPLHDSQAHRGEACAVLWVSESSQRPYVARTCPSPLEASITPRRPPMKVFNPGQSPSTLLFFVLRRWFWAASHIPGHKAPLACWSGWCISFHPWNQGGGGVEEGSSSHAHTCKHEHSLRLSYTHKHTLISTILSLRCLISSVKTEDHFICQGLVRGKPSICTGEWSPSLLPFSPHRHHPQFPKNKKFLVQVHFTWNETRGLSLTSRGTLSKTGHVWKKFQECKPLGISRKRGLDVHSFPGAPAMNYRKLRGPKQWTLTLSLL